MDDQIPMCVLDRLANLEEHAQGVIDLESAFLAIARDRPSVDALHDEVRCPPIGDPAVEQCDGTA